MADPSEHGCDTRQEPTTTGNTYPTTEDCIAMNTSTKTPLDHPALLEQSGMESEEIGQGVDIRQQPTASLQLEGIDEDSSSRERMQEYCSEKSEHGLCAGPGGGDTEHGLCAGLEVVSREDTEHRLCTGSGTIRNECAEYSKTEAQHRTNAAETVEKCIIKASDDDNGGEPPEELEEHIEMETATTVQHQHTYKLGQELKLLTGSWKEFDCNNYLRGCKWAPDGTCLLSCSEDKRMRLHNLPTELYSGVVDGLSEVTSVLTVPQGETVYDFCWYPKMSSWDSATCCFATCCKDHPVHLWDAFCHHKRASYVPHNHLDEVVAPHSLAFSSDGDKLYCGFPKCVRVFDTARPGRNCVTRSLCERRLGGQPGIISCIAMHPFTAGMYALGSYSCSVGLYSDSTEGPLMLLTALDSGITHMVFAEDGNHLYTGFRKSNLIKCWDLRYPGKSVYSLTREVSTNQRIYFDLYSHGRYLISGSTDSHIYGWDLLHLSGDESTPQRCLYFQGHSDAVNGCSVHPTLPLLATSSGQRTFNLPFSSSESDSDDDRSHPDNSIKLWSMLGKDAGAYEDLSRSLALNE